MSQNVFSTTKKCKIYSKLIGQKKKKKSRRLNLAHGLWFANFYSRILTSKFISTEDSLHTKYVFHLLSKLHGNFIFFWDTNPIVLQSIFS